MRAAGDTVIAESHDGRTATFDFNGGKVEVTYLPAVWRVTVGDKTAESRRLDEALANFLESPREVTRLAVDILHWALTG